VPIATGPAPLRIGSIKAPYSDHSGVGCYNCAGTWYGVIDDVRTYNRALSSEEKLALYHDSSNEQPSEEGCQEWIDQKVKEKALTYGPSGAIHAYPNLIWPPDNKLRTVLLEGYVSSDNLSLIRFSNPGFASVFAMVSGQRIELTLDQNNRFTANATVKALKNALYLVTLWTLDSNGADHLIDNTYIVVGDNMANSLRF
jgi:hypothetical protein